MELAFAYLQTNKLEKESDYPYTGKQGTCKYSSTKGVTNTKGYKQVTRNSPSALVSALSSQPVSVAIEADTAVFQSYSTGVISSTGCGTNLDHGVLAVGYGTDPKLGDFYKVKNSWGTRWGEKGYVRIKRTSTNDAGICGIQKDASYPQV